ncbi:MAG: hypothetical protein U0176_09885 [Bacteroidia bacterium]
MGKSTQDDLHDLIHCLDAAEKGHFSKYAQRHALKDGNNYEQLFQVLAKMPTYDADAVTAAMKKLGIQTPLAAAKNHLKSILLRAMRDYNSGRTTHTRLLEGLENLAFLHEKKQYDLLRKEIKRLKKMAEMYAEHHVLFKIGEYERRLHKETAQREMTEGMEEIHEEMLQKARAFQNQLQFAHLLDKMFVVASKAGPDREQAVNAILAAELLASEENAMTFFARIYYHQIHAIAHMLKGQAAASQRKYGAVLSLWEGAPHLIEEYPTWYRRILSNYLSICGETGDYEAFEQTLAKVRNSPAQQLSDEAEIFSIGFNAELIWRMGTADWAGVAEMVPALESGLQRFAEILRRGTVLVLAYHVAVFYFLSGEQGLCNKWLRMITEAGRTEQRMDIQRIAQAMGLVLIWMRGDLDLLAYELRSVQRYFENWGGGVVEQHVLQLMQALLQAKGSKETQSAFAAFQEALSAPNIAPLLGCNVFQAWATAQLTGESPRALIAKSGKP